MNQSKTVKNIKITCCYTENGDEVEKILANSFNFFLENLTKKCYNNINERLLTGGTKCTNK